MGMKWKVDKIQSGILSQVIMKSNRFVGSLS